MRADAAQDLSTRLERARAAGLVRVDLTEVDPARCGLNGRDGELAPLPASRGFRAPADAREAVASYLAGHGAAVPPDRIVLAPSHAAALRLALEAVCDPGDEVLLPAPARVAGWTRAEGVRPVRYPLRFDEVWAIDRRPLRRALGGRRRALVAGNPAEPTGAVVDRAELAFLDALCAEHGMALVGDERLLDTAGEGVTVACAARCVALHVSDAAGVCGARTDAAWIAVAGAEPLAAAAAARVALLAEAEPRPPEHVLAALPSLLARREPFLDALRRRLSRNRGAIAAAALREAPWALQWGHGGTCAVVQINPGRDETELCVALLADGVAVRPGRLDGLASEGHLVVSLLPEPDVFDAGLERIEAHLRRTA